MDANQLRKRLGRSDRGNRYRTSRRVQVGVGPRDRPGARESTELALLDREIDRRDQLGRKYSGVEPRIQVRPCLAQYLPLLYYIKSRALQVAIIRPGQHDCFLDREYRSA